MVWMALGETSAEKAWPANLGAKAIVDQCGYEREKRVARNLCHDWAWDQTQLHQSQRK